MADQAFSIGMAVGVQTALGTINATIDGLTGSLTTADGIVLGDRESGDGESGITIPNFERVKRELADVSGSFTKQASTFLRVAGASFQVDAQLKGNGASATPAVGEAILDPGLDALLSSGGLVGANGASNAEYEYTPRHSGSSGGATVYSTVKLWIGDLSWTFQDCLVNPTFVVTPAGVTILQAAIEIGSVASFSDTVTFPTFNYGTQASLAAPIVEGVNNSWGATRGFQPITVAIQNDIEEIEDSNQLTGVRKVQNGRTISVAGPFYINDTDSDFEYQKTIGAVAPTEDVTFQVGTPATIASDVVNAYLFQIKNVEVDDLSYDKAGTAMVADVTGTATGTTAGNEFLLRMN